MQRYPSAKLGPGGGGLSPLPKCSPDACTLVTPPHTPPHTPTLSHTRPHTHTSQVGKRVYDDFAEQTKIDREMKKFPQQQIIGFRIIGMRVSE